MVLVCHTSYIVYQYKNTFKGTRYSIQYHKSVGGHFESTPFLKKHVLNVFQPKHFPDPQRATKRPFFLFSFFSVTVTQCEYTGRKDVMYYRQVTSSKARGYIQNTKITTFTFFHFLKHVFSRFYTKKKDIQKVHLQTKETRQYARFIYSHFFSGFSFLL